MPREPMELEVGVERISVLSEEGELDEELAPAVDDDTLRRMLRTMLLARRFDDRLLELQRQGRIGTFAPVKGQEASQIGAVSALRESDWFVPSYRDIAAALWRGWSPVDLTTFNAGYNEGVRIPEDAHDLPTAVPVASQVPHAAGLGYAARYRDTDEVVMTFFGDGATSEGDFHEGMNFAGAFGLPVVFVCQNNQWAISTPRDRQSAASTLAQKALAYGVPGVQVDGNDILAVHLAAREAVERARNGEGPTLIECVTYRMSLHTTADDPTRYRDDEEVEEWKKRDPIARFRDHLVERDVLEEDEAQELEDEVDREVGEVWDEAKKAIESLPGPEMMFDHLYTERPPELDLQAEALATTGNGRPEGGWVGSAAAGEGGDHE